MQKLIFKWFLGFISHITEFLPYAVVAFFIFPNSYMESHFGNLRLRRFVHRLPNYIANIATATYITLHLTANSIPHITNFNVCQYLCSLSYAICDRITLHKK